jgi:hypothetical protein
MEHVRKPEGQKRLKNLGIDGKIILKWVLSKSVGGSCLDWSSSIQEQLGRFENSYKRSVSRKY